MAFSESECKGQGLLIVILYAQVAVAKSWGTGGQIGEKCYLES